VKWQKGARIAVVVVGVGTLGAVLATMRQRESPGSVASVDREDRKAVAEVAGSRVTQATGMRIPGFIDSERYFAYEDGSLRFVKPKLTTTRAGRDFVLEAREGNLGPDQSHMTVNGDVVLRASDGLTATADEARYSSGEQVVRVPGKVEFSRGAMSGSGVGMTYDQPREVVWLLDQARIHVKAQKGKDPGMDITAGAAGLARREKYVRFERSFHATREGREMSADSAIAYLTDDEERLKSLELRGHSSILMGAPTEGGVESLSGRDANLTYADDGQTLEHVVLAGGAAINLAGAAGQPGRRIAGEVITIDLAPDGAVTNLIARDKVALTLPPTAEAPARTITAATMDAVGEAGRGLTGARFTDNVEFREQKPGAPVRIARSRTLSVVLAAGGGVDDALFGGGTRFEDGALVATAVDARYRIAAGTLALTGLLAGKPPEVRNERLIVNATTIDLTLDGPRLVAKGSVQSVTQPARQKPGEKAAEGATVPGLLKSDAPANVTAAALDYDGAIDKAVYTGAARLWQGQTAIAGETITIDERTGNLTASGSVRSTLPFEQVDTKTNEKQKVTSIASSQDLHYEEALRRATYTTNAHVDGPQGDLRAVKIEMYLVEGGGSLEKVEAYDKVTLKTDERTATGQRMTYFAGEERYVMTGAPVTIVEACRETTCKVLTFFRSTDRVLCDGSEEKRTKTVGGGTCAGKPAQK
jgi:lipopolysaccharide export system protein LptA